MKNWIARLFGRAGDSAPARPASARAAVPAFPPAAAPSNAPSGVAPAAASLAPDAARAGTGPAPDIDLLFWRWLCGLSPGSVPMAAADGAGARLVLDELARLARAPGEAAELVPRVPEVIPRLLRSLRDEGVSGAELAQQVTRDALLVAEVIREANSPFYRQAKPVRSVDAALLVLGQNGLRMLLARAAFRPIMGAATGRFARAAAARLWRHAERCARAAALLAPAHAVDPFEACLAGLMLDVGLIVALRLLDQLLDAQPVPQAPAQAAAIGAAARELAARIALHWELPPPIGAAILNAGQADAQPLARALHQADRLARLRLLLDAGALAPGAPPLTQLSGAAARIFDGLAPEPG